MFGYKRPYSGKRRGYYSLGRPYSKLMRRGTIARAAAGAAAAKRSDKSETYSCTVNGVCTCLLPANEQLTNIRVFHPYNGGLTHNNIPNDQGNLVLGGAVNDRGYRMKSACYDEVKLDSMKVTLSPAQVLVNGNVTFTACTMWDRKASPKECGFTGDAAWMANGSMPSPMEIFNNEGTIKSILTNNTIYGLKRYCRASSILEKGGYHDSSILYNDTQEQSPLLYMYQDAWMRSALPFAPALFLTLYAPAAAAADLVIGLSYKVEYTFTFRNPKSDLDWFLTVESPGYVNPIPGTKQSPAKKSIPKELSDEFRAIYLLKNSRSMSLIDAKSTMKSIFTESETKKPVDEEEEDDVPIKPDEESEMK